MKQGDLIIITRSPWDTRALFGYKNGDVAMILEVFPYPTQISLPSLRVFIFASEKIITIPLIYATDLGD
tara:strand:- start:318 stop:524 length:207 start_codon:yes stop_codon:yes gene_type:complete